MDSIERADQIFRDYIAKSHDPVNGAVGTFHQYDMRPDAHKLDNKVARARLQVYEQIMRGVTCIPSALLLGIMVAACNRLPVAASIHPGSGEIKMEFDTNGDGRPDVTKFYKNNQLIRVERDRNFDGKPDLIQEYDRGVIVREIHDDDFDGKPEMIKIFRKGVLAIIERDPLERGAIANDLAAYIGVPACL